MTRRSCPPQVRQRGGHDVRSREEPLEQSQGLHEGDLTVEDLARQGIVLGRLLPGIDRLLAVCGDICRIETDHLDVGFRVLAENHGVLHQNVLAQRSGNLARGNRERGLVGIRQGVIGRRLAT